MYLFFVCLDYWLANMPPKKVIQNKGLKSIVQSKISDLFKPSTKQNEDNEASNE